MMSGRLRTAHVLALVLLIAGSAGGCGQQGPLVLPDDARPIERLEIPPAEVEPRDDERRDER
jgi:predicted small lipoprotein YifL